MDSHLLIHNVASVASAIAGFCLVIFLLVNNPRSAAVRAFAGVLFCAFVFILSHVVGVNITDPVLSKDVLMFNLVTFLLPVLTLHAVLAVTDKVKERRGLLMFLYASGIALIVFFLFFPNLFLLPSVPKLYFPNYYNPGVLNWTRLAFMYVVVVPYSLYELAISFVAAQSQAERNKMKYLFITILGGYAIGYIPNFLVYNVDIDPLWGVWFFFIIGAPLIYGAVKYELFDVKIVAKQAFVYAIGIAVVGSFIAFVDYTNEKLLATYPFIPVWIAPLASAILVVSTSFFIWRRLRETDAMKAEFITVVTHKFRTPLTQIRWGTENLSPDLAQTDKEMINEIRQANYRLIDLTNLLVQLSDTDTVDFNYHMEPQRLDTIVDDLKEDYVRRATLKKIALSFNGQSVSRIMIDQAQIRFVVQTLFDNALSYTPSGGSVHIDISENKSVPRNPYIELKVADTGIGLSKEDDSRLFQKFWRSHGALAADTEGMGIGLFMAQRIVKRHNGTLRGESEGIGKGTTFVLRFPISTQK